MHRIEKKAWPEWFEEVITGNKTYEYRLADFDVAPGDILVMREWDPKTGEYTGRVAEAKIGHIGKVSARRWDKPEDERLYPHYILSLLELKHVNVQTD
jgi:hypothetical protein